MSSGPPHCYRSAWEPFGWLKVWILFCTSCSATGWLLAGLGQLNCWGYALTLPLALFGVRFVCAAPARLSLRIRWPSVRLRILPVSFGLLALLSFVGGVLYAPSNYDALAYRFPQILHWLGSGRWHWIPSSELTMNITSPGFGWLVAPMFALIQSDRLAFLPSFIAYLTLPGTYFSVMRNVGVPGRVAWIWMWLLPSATCFVMQAGGVANDLLGTSFWLTAFALGFQARRSARVDNFYYSALAAALATGVKVTGLPLLLPWFLVVSPVWEVALRSPLKTVFAIVLGAVISFLPTGVLNRLNTGAWDGDPAGELMTRTKSPLVGLVGNVCEITLTSWAPPVCPMASRVNSALSHPAVAPLVGWIKSGYPRFSVSWGELAMEEGGGLGLGLTLCILLAIIYPQSRRWSGRGLLCSLRPGLVWGGFMACFAFMAVSSSEAVPRLAAPYYPLILLAVLRSRGAERFFRTPLFSWIVRAHLPLVMLAVILTPARPLWPASWLLDRALNAHPSSPLLVKAASVYATYRDRPDLYAPLRQCIPSGARFVGFICRTNDMESPLWKPYGSAQVVELFSVAAEAPRVALLRGSVIVASVGALGHRFGLTPEELAIKLGGVVAGRAMLRQKATIGPEEWVAITVSRE